MNSGKSRATTPRRRGPAPFTLAVSLAALLGCKTTAPGGSGVSSDWESQQPNGEGVFVVDWSCGIRQGYDGNGILQDEYCEWERSRVDSQGQSQKLVCDFRTSFDTRRQWWLPMRDKTREFEHTVNNTNPALVLLVSDCSAKPGAHCEKTGDPDLLVPCVPERASDPEVCRKVNAMVHTNKKKVALIPLPSAEGMGDIVIAPEGMALLPKAPQPEPFDARLGIQLGLISPIPDFCRYDVDPKFKQMLVEAKWTPERIAAFARDEKTFVHCEIEGEMLDMYASCDEIASQIKAGVRVKISN